MSLEKRFQEQFREHRINPSAMPWERIEAELDKSKKRPVFVIYSRWAAAASVALLITAYANWNHLPMGSNLAAAKEKAAQQNTAQQAIAPEVKNDVTATIPLTQNTDTKGVAKNNQVAQHHHNQTKPIIQQAVTPESVAVLQAEIQKNTAVQNVIITKRNFENMLTLSNRPTAAISNTREDVALNLPAIPASLIEKARINRKWKTYLNEEISEDSDSTLTERAFVMVDQKTRTFVQRTWKPMLKEFFRLRKGF